MSAESAGYFQPFEPVGYREQARKILYIGKATDGMFQEENAAQLAFEHKKSHFWSFADDVSALADRNVHGRNNLVWSNIFKQGVTQGNPDSSQAAVQRPEAVRLLREEIKTYEPNLIVLVTAGYEEKVVKEAFYIRDGEAADDNDGKLHEQELDGSKYSIWWRRPYSGVPALLWMNHPQGKLRVYKDAALKQIATLMDWKQQ